MEVYLNLELEDIVINDEVEVWMQVNSIDGLSEVKDYYYISNFGRVKSVGGKFGDRVMKQSNDKDGYLKIGLAKSDGKLKMMRVHRLVGLAFVEGHSKERNQSNHINEVKTDNRAVNLNWMTAKENINHGARNERVAEKLAMPVVGECVKTGNVIYFESSQDAGRNGFNQGHVARACRGKYNPNGKHGGTNIFKGYRWKFKESA